jgi:hypothetical protein
MLLELMGVNRRRSGRKKSRKEERKEKVRGMENHEDWKSWISGDVPCVLVYFMVLL